MGRERQGPLVRGRFTFLHQISLVVQRRWPAFSQDIRQSAALKTKVVAIDEAWYRDWLRVDLT
jgi:hypothetical protein